jgi:tetratricopeptide (TPR) repeat protein
MTARRSISLGIAAAILCLVHTFTASAQVGELRGNILLRQADGQAVPLADAQIDVFRTDLSSRYQTKTNKKGEFVFAGLPYVGTYIVAASSPIAAPKWVSNVRSGRDMVVELTLDPGDGRRLTFDEIKRAAGINTESSADAAKRDELARKNAEIDAQNQKIVAANDVLAREFKAGNDEVSAAIAADRAGTHEAAIQHYTAAVAHYDAALGADREQPSVLTNKAVALSRRGVERFNAAVKTKPVDDAAVRAAKDDFKAAAAISAMIQAHAAPTEPGALRGYQANRYAAVKAYAESMRLYVTKSDPKQAEAAHNAYKAYITLEADPASRSKAQLDMAQMLLDAGSPESALVEFRTILAMDPSNARANLGAGTAIFSMGDNSQMRQAATYLQHYLDVAPDSDPMKADVREILFYIKRTLNTP